MENAVAGLLVVLSVILIVATVLSAQSNFTVDLSKTYPCTPGMCEINGGCAQIRYSNEVPINGKCSNGRPATSDNHCVINGCIDMVPPGQLHKNTPFDLYPPNNDDDETESFLNVSRFATRY